MAVVNRGRGRPRKSRESKEAAGTLRPHRERKAAARESAAAKAAPALSRPKKTGAEEVQPLQDGKPGVVKSRIWRQLAPRLVDCGIMAELDSVAFGSLVDTIYEYQKVQRKVGTQYLLDDGEGGQKENPAYKLLRTLRAEMNSQLKDFGMTPAGRGRIIMEVAEKKAAAKAMGFLDEE